MKRYAISHIPLTFLFLPTVLACIAVYLFFNAQLQSRYEQQLRAHAGFVLKQVAQLTREPLLQRRYSQLKQHLWSFAQSAEPGIENIVVYDTSGELVTALNLDENVVEFQLEQFPKVTFYPQGHLFHAWSTVDINRSANEAVTIGDASGYLWVTFNFDSFGLDNERNILVVVAIILLSTFIGTVLWRYRYALFNQQLMLVNESLVGLNKGYKHVKLPGIKGYRELNMLQQQLNGLVGFYEKRLTMKQFEVTALERTLSKADERHQADREQMNELQSKLETSKVVSSSLATDMYEVCYQTLQAQLASIESVVNKHQVAQALCPEAESAKITDAVNHLNQMLSQLKDLCEVIKGGRRAQLDHVRSKQLIASVSQLVKPLAQSKGLEFIITPEPFDVDIEIDVNQLQKVLFTLLQNAFNATELGYIKLTFEVTELTQADESGNSHCLSCQVLDTGCGLTDVRYDLIASDEVDSILADDDWILWGLNLMVAKKTVEWMHGEFRVKSLTGLGAQISADFPCRVSYPEVPDMSRYHGYRVLLFDPIEQSAQPIIDCLGKHDMEVVHCRDDKQLLQAMRSMAFACVVFCRPGAQKNYRRFDDSIKVLISEDKLTHCLFLTDSDTLDYGLPAHWLKVEKPFHLSDFIDYYPSNGEQQPQMISGEALVVPELDRKRIEILAVDDNETNLKLLSVILRDQPVKLSEALCGAQALEICATQRFDIILMDKEMPEMNGLEASHKIRRLPLHQNTPIVIFTAHIDDGEKREILQQVDDCIVKPFDNEKMTYLMERWCSKRWINISAL